MTRLVINSERLHAELAALATFTDCPAEASVGFVQPATAVTRVVFTQRDLEARRWLTGLALEAGLGVRVDAVGNTFLRFEGSEPALAAVGTGSHMDAIPHAGMYDGTVGVLGGLEAMRALKESGFVPRRSIETVMFTSEEPTRFGIGCLGSRLMGGALDPEVADGFVDRLSESDASAVTGLTLQEVRQAAGFSGSLHSVRLEEGYFDAWVELHIEQGPLLERSGTPIGIVTNIAAPASYRFRVEGLGGHAGALLMPDRRDALCAAAEIVLAVERHTLEANAAAAGVNSVATVGALVLQPGAVNSVPSRVELMLDIRDTDVARREGIMAAVRADVAAMAMRRGVRVVEEKINADMPAVSDPRMIAILRDVCQAEGVAYQKMVSRAYHDTSFMARVAPVAMIFIPCRGGVSHRPDEYAAPEAITAGVRVLGLALARLAE